MNLEQEARKKIQKAMKTIEYLSSRLADNTLAQHKRQFIQDDIDTLEFLIEYAKEALSQRGIRV